VVFEAIAFIVFVEILTASKFIKLAFVATTSFAFRVCVFTVCEFTVARSAVPVAVIFAIAMFVPVAFSNNKFVKYVDIDEIKLVTILPLFSIFSEVVVPVNLIAFNSVIELVDTTPFTFEVMRLAPVDVAYSITFVVLDANMPASEVVETTPFISLDNTPAFAVKLLEVTILVVASTPFMFVVKTFPVADCVKEFMKLVTADEMPLTIEVKEFVVVDIVFVVLEAIAFTVLVDKLLTSKFVATKFVIVAFVAVTESKIGLLEKE
jgi:hypothetical protein